jgi:hypothetical protein
MIVSHHCHTAGQADVQNSVPAPRTTEERFQGSVYRDVPFAVLFIIVFATVIGLVH